MNEVWDIIKTIFDWGFWIFIIFGVLFMIFGEYLLDALYKLLILIVKLIIYPFFAIYFFLVLFFLVFDSFFHTKIADFLTKFIPKEYTERKIDTTTQKEN